MNGIYIQWHFEYISIAILFWKRYTSVYRAVSPKGDHVAIKIPKNLDDTVDMSVLDAFKAEANIWEKLKHKNIVTFYLGDILPIPYLVIELMEGGNLEDFLEVHQFTVGESMSLMYQLLDGIAYAHRMATAHRDIKPKNILFTKDGIPKISDWGIGKLMASDGDSFDSELKGTLSYCAPEQIKGEEYGEVDWQTDVFQLGVVFYEVLTGKHPFEAENTVKTLNNILNKIPSPPSSLRSEIPPELDTIILHALEKDKANRFKTAETMLAKLSELLKNQ